MHHSSSSVVEVKKLLAIALPIMGAQIAQSSMSVADTLMVGRLGADPLAAIALGTSIWMPLYLFLAGCLLGITPFVAQWTGAKESAKIGAFTFQGIWFGSIIALVSILLMYHSQWLLFWLEVPEHLHPMIADYLIGIMLGFPALAVYQTLRSYTEGLGFTQPVLVISLICLVIDVIANAILIYGFGPIPALGVLGCGLGTAIAMWSSVGLMWLNIRYRRRYKDSSPLDHFARPDWQSISEIAKVGTPIGIAIFFEVGLFTTIALFIARLGSTEVAAHQIALNVTSVTFMVPLSLAMALTVRVGHGLGESGYLQAKMAAKVGVLCTVGASFVISAMIWLLASSIAGLYTPDQGVVELAVALLYFAAIFQLSDALQVSASGALRGYKDTKIIMPITLFSYWGVGMGLGYVLALTDWLIAPVGVKGFWIGLIAGLSCAALLLCWRLYKTSESEPLVPARTVKSE
ncbi:multidrug resistance protein, MATE family [Oceanospirillum multiglobuliferum]|uniref:Multidrug-efflux transporter n=1 Tax=Oceanospirillum multiglobuliferum TaxID=64969 RepID=A0A1T4RPA1_9GAMM|nr:MATE family efflux transporter [Oceanospirillum multiglobuliferum]OPX54660.1 hypothetical protein BTE48_12815 [Oceanospirillum multiglobuliferum]SKA17783.1 multidrug resistance protein, MATE family [Oceanospirillum multiglobuliferum]